MSYRLLNLKKPRLFEPKFSRGSPAGSFAASQNNIVVKGTIGDSSSTGSFRYSPDQSLKSTQELNIDYSYFENHTFFDSALSKTNIVFDKIINKYPFDGTLKEVESFEDNLTGFENWVIDTSYPKSTGSLHLSGTAVGENPSAGYTAGLGQFIIVKDAKGYQYPKFSKNSDSVPVLDPGPMPFSIDFFIKLPTQANDNQIIVQKRSSISKNITLALESSTSTNSAGLKFGLTYGSDYLFASGNISKGEFNHISAQFDRSTSQHKLNIYLNGKILSSSSEQFEITSLDFNNSDFLIGTGSEVRINELIFTPAQTLSASIDEFRYFHSLRSESMLKSQMFKNIYAADDLKLYYKFNEVKADHSLRDVVLDASGNSLHSKINNFTLNSRDPENPLTAEDISRNPVLFYVNSVDTLYQGLINSASFYDEFNPNLITKLFPAHYFLEGDEFEGYDFNNPLSNLEKIPTQSSLPGTAQFGTTQLLISFLLIWAKFFDELKLFVDGFGDLRDVNYETEDTVPDAFLKSLAEYYNIELPDLFPNANLDQLVDGVDIYDSFSKRSEYTLNYIQNEVWRRLLTNAVHINKSTGTIEGLRGILRTIGINVDDIFTIREYGGQSKITLDGVRINKTDNLRQLLFTGSLSNTVVSLSAQGIPDKKPYLLGSYLSGSRIEVGTPAIQGTFVNKAQFSPHGISNNASDGLMTSGSFTFEGTYRFPTLLTGSYPVYQSLARIHVTGSNNSSATHGVVTNLVVKSGSVPEIYFYARPGSDNAVADSPLLAMHIYSASIFDGGMWNVSFGRRRGDLTNILNNEEKSVSSSYFLRVGKSGDRRLDAVYTTSSFFKERIASAYYTNAFQVIDTNRNASGSFLIIGSQSIETSTATSRYLNNSTINQNTRTTNFAGEAGLVRFWSEEVSEKAWKEHVRNPTSVGVDDPAKNYNFLLHNTGTFEQMRVYTIAKQATTASDALGGITLFDFSQNDLNFAGTGFEPQKLVFASDQLRYSTLNPQFDVLGTTDKVRIRSIQDTDRLLGGGYPYASTAPAYNVPENEEVFDDLRFSLEMSLVKALNEDIINLFSDYQFIENSLGRTNLLFSEKYPQLDQVRKNYFENTTGKLNIEKYYKLFKWFNDTFTATIEKMLPAKTKFMGVNFVIESHALERHKFKYYYDEIYLKALQRDPFRGTILLSQFVGNLKKF